MSYQEGERYIQALRPFVLSQRLYEHLVTGSVTAELDISRPFRALCGEVLGAQTAYLAALGPLAPLVGPVGYPRPVSNPTWSLIDLAGKFDSPQTICIDRKSTRLNSSHQIISYAVFCLKKKISIRY